MSKAGLDFVDLVTLSFLDILRQYIALVTSPAFALAKGAILYLCKEDITQ